MQKKALIVQEPGFARTHMQRALANAGFQVYETESGRHVLRDNFSDFVNLEDMDIVLMDVALPDMDGDEIIKMLNQKMPDLPVIVVSTEKTRDRIIQLIDMGAWDFLVKPVESQLLIKRVSRQIEKTGEKLNKKQPSSTDATSSDKVTSVRSGGESRKAEDPAATVRSKTELSPETNWRQLELQLMEEIDRAIRTHAALTLLKVRGSRQEIKELVSAAEMTLRRIDSVFYLEHAAVLVLPATKIDGVAVVKEKLLNVFNEITNQTDNRLAFHELRFLHEDYQAEVETYRVEDITEDMLRRLQALL